MFRYERPQAGRLRQFHQIGVECFGSSNPATDVETIAMAAHFLKAIGIQGVKLHLNTLGNPESRAAYRQALIDYLTPLKDSLSKDSQRRLEENPLRVLDSRKKKTRWQWRMHHLSWITWMQKAKPTLMLFARCWKISE